jgi:hypothetical protein
MKVDDQGLGLFVDGRVEASLECSALEDEFSILQQRHGSHLTLHRECLVAKGLTTFVGRMARRGRLWVLPRLSKKRFKCWMDHVHLLTSTLGITEIAAPKPTGHEVLEETK